MIHAVKTIPQYFEDVISGRKPFEVRKNDRDYRECDYIALNEYDPKADAPEEKRYTGRSALFRISYILDNPEFCKDGYVVMGLDPCTFNGTHPGERLSVLHGQARGGEKD